ncbi:MAG: ATP-binding cassette domain-containing protein [Coriobacteriia bacterium]|nr:ATP-binding cassette domain-containing protein [Coriobacteriia bacterium]
MEREVLVVRGLRKTIRGRNLVCEIAFTVSEGEIVGLLGPNGAGKTTIMKCTTGLMRANEGEIEICQEPFTCRDSRLLINVGAIIENPAFYDYMTGWKNLAQYMRASKMSVNATRMQEVVDMVKLDDVIHSKVKTYSLGMKQRLGLAQAIIRNPKLLILDEPMNGLDPRGVIDLRNLLVALSNQGTAIIVSSHLLSEIEKIATRVLFIDEGKIIGDESLEGVGRDMISLEEKYMKITSGEAIA